MTRAPTFPLRIAAWTAGLTGVTRAALASLLGAISVLAFAPLHFWPVLFVSFGGLVWLLDGCHASHKSLRDRLKCASLTGFWFGYGYFFTGLYWIAEAFLVEPWRHGWLIPFVMMALPGGMALFFAAGSLGAMALWRPGAARAFALALALGLSEYARSHVLTGLPWNLIGYGLLANEPLMQLASLFGVYSLSLLAVLFFAAPAAIFSARTQGGSEGTHGKGAAQLCIFLFALLIASYVWGSFRLMTEPGEATDLRLRLVQANIDQADKWRPENAEKIFDDYLDMTERAGLDTINIVIWPETALPFFLDASPDALAAIGQNLPGDTVLLVGVARTADRRGEDGRVTRRDVYNSLLAIDSEGKVLGGYDKMHLVPFGEYLPFQDFLESLGIMQMTGVRGGFSKGTGPRLLEIPNGPTILALICYESIFPDEIVTDATATSVRPGWMLNVTNDAWFGSSAGPYQHFHQARIRAVEQGLPLVRAANTGISAVIDPWGRILAKIGLDKKGVIDANLPQVGRKTVYVLFKIWIEAFVLALALLGWFLCRSSGIPAHLTG